MTTEQATELIEKAREVRWKDIGTKEGNKLLKDAYLLIFKSELCDTCPGDYKNAYYAIRSYIENPNVIKPMKEKSNFVIKGTGIILEPETGNMFSNLNLTDEIAERLLNENPNLVSRFEKIPETFQLRSVVSKEITGEDLLNSIDNSLMGAIQHIESLTERSELVKIATENGYEKNEWQKKDLKKFKKYLIEKLKAA